MDRVLLRVHMHVPYTSTTAIPIRQRAVLWWTQTLSRHPRIHTHTHTHTHTHVLRTRTRNNTRDKNNLRRRCVREQQHSRHQQLARGATQRAAPEHARANVHQCPPSKCQLSATCAWCYTACSANVHRPSVNLARRRTKLQRELPLMTPSGLSIGNTRNSNAWRSCSASLAELVRNDTMPRMIHDAFVSPGCTRALGWVADCMCKSTRSPCVCVSVLATVALANKQAWPSRNRANRALGFWKSMRNPLS
jgi:hypothetical protein